MEKEVQDEQQIRHYLLGQLAEAEQTRVEERMMTDDGYFELLLVVEDELIDESTSGALSAEDQERFNRHFLSTSERRERVQFAETLKAYVNPKDDEPVPLPNDDPAPIPPPRPAWWKLSNPYVRLAAAAIILLAVGLVFWRSSSHPPVGSKESQGMAALRAAYPAQRPTDARITGLDYAQAPPVTRGSEPEQFDYATRDQAEFLIRDAASKHPDAQSYHDLGRLYLVKHEYDKAIDQFEKALKLNDQNAQLESDYGAALLEMGKKENTGKRLETLARALEHLSRAIELNDSLLEALFNRALCRQEMKLDQQAAEAWRAYLEKDSTSKWANEAREHLKELEERKQKAAQNKEQLFQDFLSAYQAGNDENAWRTLSQSRLRTGNSIAEKLIDDYLNLALTSQTAEADAHLVMLRYAGRVETQRAHDHFTADLARVYSQATPSQQERLIQARKLMKSGHARFNQSDFESAIELYANAKKSFERANDFPEARFAELWIGNSHLRIPDTSKSLSVLESLARVSEANLYGWILAQSLNGISDAKTGTNDLSQAIAYAARSMKVAEQIQDVGGVLRNLQQFVSMHLRLGNYQQSLGYSAQALQLFETLSPDPKQTWPFYHEMALDCYWLGCYRASLDVEVQALWLAQESNWPLIISRSYSRLGLIYEKLGNYQAALRNGQLAFEEGGKITGKSRANTVALSALRLGHLYRLTGDAFQALKSYDLALQLYEDLNFQAYLYEAHKGKFLAYLAQDNDERAREELDATLSLFEQYRAKITEENYRDRFFDIEQTFYDLAIDFEFSKMKDSRQAFEYSEQCRARSLLDMMQAAPSVIDGEGGPDNKLISATNPLRLSEIQTQLPEQTQLLQYAVLNGKLLIWVISKTDIRSKEHVISVEQLDEKIFDHRHLMSGAYESKQQETKDLAKELYEILIGPVENFLKREKQLCIIPDKALHFASYNALLSPATNKYLVEDYVISIAPSASVFIACSNAARKKEATRRERLLAVGNPTFDRAKYPLLTDLASASREAQQIAAYYDSLPLIGDQATREKVRCELPQADVTHLALHAINDDNSPMLSKLVLAKEPTEPSPRQGCNDALQAYEIYKMKLPRMRLLVLSACQTGIEKAYGGEGAISIARSFISAGVPLVVASLWPVESKVTADLMISFHKYRKQKTDPLSTAAALRAAQLEMLNRADERNHSPYYWASFAVIGGYAKF